MDNETKARRAKLLRRQVEIEEQHCQPCKQTPGVFNCGICIYGKELLEIGNTLIDSVGPRRTPQKGYVIPVITDDLIAAAKKNDIPLSTLRHRVQQLYWPIEKAATKPVDKRKRHRGATR